MMIMIDLWRCPSSVASRHLLPASGGEKGTIANCANFPSPRRLRGEGAPTGADEGQRRASEIVRPLISFTPISAGAPCF